MRGIALAAEVIPDELLLEDAELQAVVQRDGRCWAIVERQVDWDCYRVRIAARQSYLHYKEQSHLIFVSALQLGALEDRGQEMHCHPAKKASICTEVPVAKKHQKEMKTHTVYVSEADLRIAAGTMEPLGKNDLAHKSSAHLQGKVQRWIDLMLFRAVLIALKCQERLREKIRQVLVSRHRLGERLINVEELYEENDQRYWSARIRIPVCWMS